MVTYGSTKKVWWRCPNNHTYQATVNNRSSGIGCPFCSGRRPVTGQTDLRSMRPDIVTEWHYEKNAPLMPDMISAGSKKVVWWKCKYQHEWKAAVYSRSEGNGCPICSKRSHSSLPEQAVYYYVKQYFPDLINSYNIPGTRFELDIYVPSLSVGIEYDGAAWHNNAVTLSREERKYRLCLSKGISLIRIKEILEDDPVSNCDVLLVTSKSPQFYELDFIISNVLQHLGINTAVNCKNDLEKIRMQYLVSDEKRSLAIVAPHLVKEWHPEKNGKMTPYLIMSNAHDKNWWKCAKGHEWQAAAYSRVHGNGCPYCSGQKVLIGYNDLATTHTELIKECILPKILL